MLKVEWSEIRRAFVGFRFSTQPTIAIRHPCPFKAAQSQSECGLLILPLDHHAPQQNFSLLKYNGCSSLPKKMEKPYNYQK